MDWMTLLPLMIFGAALLYSSVGHAGASGYIAAMAIAGVAPDVMRPAALVLNVLVASIGTFRFYRAGRISRPILFPLILGSIPLSFIGGVAQLPGTLYKQLLGGVLLFAAFRLAFPPTAATSAPPAESRRIPFVGAVVIGAFIGLLAGLTGTGGGIFLTPLLLFLRWAEPKESAGVSVAFILVNSIAAIAGQLNKLQSLPGELPYWALAAVLGGLIGSELGSRRLGNLALRRLLAVVLVIAAGKLIFV
ncbi:MAG: sulfite exporter TauE/SafE family protein [Planctomycetaceae bacterium]